MTPRILLAGLAVACTFSAFAQSTGTQPDLPKQQVKQSEAETKLKNSQTGLTELQKKQVKAETGKTTSEGVSAAVQAQIDSELLLPVVSAILPGFNTLGTKLQIENELVDMLGRDNVKDSAVSALMNRLAAIVVPEQRYRVDDLQKTVVRFVHDQGPLPSSPEKEMAVKVVVKKIVDQVNQMDTREGRHSQIAMSGLAGSVFGTSSPFPSPRVPAEPIVAPTLAVSTTEQRIVPVTAVRQNRVNEFSDVMISMFTSNKNLSTWYVSFSSRFAAAPTATFGSSWRVFQGRDFKSACPSLRKDISAPYNAVGSRPLAELTLSDLSSLDEVCINLQAMTEDEADAVVLPLNKALGIYKGF
jgi:hypothetical protein